MNIFASYNIKPEDISLALWKDVLVSLKPSVTIPNPSTLKSCIQSAYDDMLYSYATVKFLPVLFVQAQKVGENYVFVSMIMSRLKMYYFVKHMLPDETADLDQLMDDFCKASIDKAAETYNKKITSIIFDVDNLIDDSYFSDKHRNGCILTRSFTYLLKNLLKGGAVINFDDQQKLFEYTSRISEIKKKCLDNSLADAMHLIYESVIDKTFQVNSNYLEILESHLGPLQYGCHNLNHVYEKEILNCSDEPVFYSASFQIHDFLTYMVPNHAFEWHYYESKTKIFHYIVKSNTNDPVKYWELSLRDFPTLGNLALDVMSIPAVPKKVDIHSLYNIIFEYARVEKSELEYRLNMFLKRF